MSTAQRLHDPSRLTTTGPGLRLLAVDEAPAALHHLAVLLAADPRVATVLTAGSATEAVRRLHDATVDAVLTEVALPRSGGLSGLDLARLAARFRQPPAVVFVTRSDDHALDAFELQAIDYVLKPVRPARLAETVRRLVAAAAARPRFPDDPAIPVELAGVTRFVHRSEVLYAEAQGDYARLHTARGSHLIRISLSTLEQDWHDAGFVRVHRSLLVALAHVDEVHVDAGRCSIVVGGQELAVSRRHTRELRDVLVRQARPSAVPTG